MKKTASQIADQVLEKLATSRWREAIRSGELAPREAETLKTRMGVDTMREARGLSKGWRGKADYHGFAPMTQLPYDDIAATQDSIRQVEGSRPLGKKRLRSVMPNVRKYKGRGPHVYLGRKPTTNYTFVPYDSGEFMDDVARSKGRRVAAGKRTQAELTGLVAGHEGSEIVEGLKGIKKGRIKLYKQRTVHSGFPGHASPRVILEEIRNARMLSPQARATMLQARRPIELSEIALQVPMRNRSQLYLPRHKLEYFSNKILKTPPISEILWGPQYGPDAAIDKWADKLIKRVRRLR